MSIADITETATLLTIPAPGPWVSTDPRFRAERPARERQWAQRTVWLARQQRIPAIVGPITVNAICHRADRKLATAEHSDATVRAVLRGLVDAKVLADDSDAHVLSTTFRPGEIVHGSQLTLIIRPEKETR